MSPFNALGRRGLIRGSATTVLGAVVTPAGSRAEAAVPQPIATNLVTASRRHWKGRDCLSLELTDDEQRGRLDKTRSGNGPSFAIVHRDFTSGVIEADIGAELTGKGALDDRGFAGLSFHIGQDFETHETVYLRAAASATAHRSGHPVRGPSGFPFRRVARSVSWPLRKGCRHRRRSLAPSSARSRRHAPSGAGGWCRSAGRGRSAPCRSPRARRALCRRRIARLFHEPRHSRRMTDTARRALTNRKSGRRVTAARRPRPCPL